MDLTRTQNILTQRGDQQALWTEDTDEEEEAPDQDSDWGTDNESETKGLGTKDTGDTGT